MVCVAFFLRVVCTNGRLGDRLVNALEDIPVSIFYDWHNDGLNTTQGESNFGTVEHTYNNASLPYIPKPSYLAAGVLQSLFRGREFVTRHPVNTALNESDDNAYAMEFEGGRLALWKVDGTTECKQDARLKLNCGMCAKLELPRVVSRAS
jgi:hypothetical protein